MINKIYIFPFSQISQGITSIFIHACKHALIALQFAENYCYRDEQFTGINMSIKIYNLQQKNGKNFTNTGAKTN